MHANINMETTTQKDVLGTLVYCIEQIVKIYVTFV